MKHVISGTVVVIIGLSVWVCEASVIRNGATSMVCGFVFCVFVYVFLSVDTSTAVGLDLVSVVTSCHGRHGLDSLENHRTYIISPYPGLKNPNMLLENPDRNRETVSCKHFS